MLKLISYYFLFPAVAWETRAVWPAAYVTSLVLGIASPRTQHNTILHFLPSWPALTYILSTHYLHTIYTLSTLYLHTIYTRHWTRDGNIPDNAHTKSLPGRRKKRQENLLLHSTFHQYSSSCLCSALSATRAQLNPIGHHGRLFRIFINPSPWH